MTHWNILRTSSFVKRSDLFNHLLTKNSLLKIDQRFASIFKVNDHLKLYTEEKRDIVKDPRTLRLGQQTNGRPLAIIFAYLGAKEKHLIKYSEFYFKHGFDVLVFRTTAWQSIMPKLMKKSTLDILKFLHSNEYYEKKIIHGFSGGGYVWAECLVHIKRDLCQHQKLLDSIKGQIWDSAAYLSEVPIGVSKLAFPKNNFLQVKFEQALKLYLKVFEKSVTFHHRTGEEAYVNTILKCPALFFVSKVDPVGDAAANFRTYKLWKERGLDVTWKCFESSPHVRHFIWHKEEYCRLLEELLGRINLARK